MSARLNPKLTKRAVYIPPSDEVNLDEDNTTISANTSSKSTSSSSNSSIKTTSTDPLRKAVTNPNLHLVHSGSWIPKCVSSFIFNLFSSLILLIYN